MAFTVKTTAGAVKNYADSARFSIGDDNGVLTITDGDDEIQYSPHAWIEVRSPEPKHYAHSG